LGGALATPDPDPMAGPDVINDDNALYQMARASMLIYLVLRQAEDTAIVPVGAAADRRGLGARVNRTGAVTLLERDSSTAWLRNELRDHQRRWQFPSDTGIDMLTAAVPGTGMTVGLSRRLYAACRALLDAQTALATRAQEEAGEAAADGRIWQVVPEPPILPDEDPYLSMPDMIFVDSPSDAQRVPRADVRTEYERRAYNRLQEEVREDLLIAAREAFMDATEQTWESIAGRDSRLALEGPPRQLESATADTYLAIDPGLIV